MKVAKGSLLTGALTDSEGVVAAAQICARDSGYQLDCVNSAADGTYALRVVAGKWRVTVDDSRYARAYVGEIAKDVTAVDGKDQPGLNYPVSIRDAGNEVCVYVSGEMVGYLPVYEQSSCVTIPLLTLKSATPKISGKIKVGKRLAVAPGLWGPAPVKLTYRWYRTGKPISKATGKSYLFTKKDKGKKISVEVTGSKTGYKTIAKKSVATKGVS